MVDYVHISIVANRSCIIIVILYITPILSCNRLMLVGCIELRNFVGFLQMSNRSQGSASPSRSDSASSPQQSAVVRAEVTADRVNERSRQSPDRTCECEDEHTCGLENSWSWSTTVSSDSSELTSSGSYSSDSSTRDTHNSSSSSEDGSGVNSHSSEENKSTGTDRNRSSSYNSNDTEYDLLGMASLSNGPASVTSSILDLWQQSNETLRCRVTEINRLRPVGHRPKLAYTCRRDPHCRRASLHQRHYRWVQLNSLINRLQSTEPPKRPKPSGMEFKSKMA